MSAIRRLRGRLGAERGFTLIELMMATLVAAIGIGAVTTVLTGSRELVSDSERGSSAAHVGEREMERALAVPYAKLALKQTPGTSTDAKDPRYHVAVSGGAWTYRWSQSAGATEPAARGLTDATGDLDASTPWDDGRQRGTVYRFVTVYDDTSIANDPAAAPPLLPDGEGKRVTIVVTVDGGRRERKPVLLSSVVLP